MRRGPDVAETFEASDVPTFGPQVRVQMFITCARPAQVVRPIAASSYRS
jgi:hypothetical protein